MNDKTSIYSESYTTALADTAKITDKKEILEELRGQKAMADRARKVGLLLKEEKATAQGLRRKVRTLESEVRQLKEVIAGQLREEQSRRSLKGEPR